MTGITIKKHGLLKKNVICTFAMMNQFPAVENNILLFTLNEIMYPPMVAMMLSFNFMHIKVLC